MDVADVPVVVGSSRGRREMTPRLSSRQALSVAHFSIADGGGGAAGAVRRLHREFVRQGVRSTLHVAQKHTADADTECLSDGLLLGHRAPAFSRKLDLLPMRISHPRSSAFWSPGWHSLRDITRLPSVIAADVLALYWLPRGFLGIRQVGRLLSLGKPVVWRLSDMWPFTGGCHYSADCTAFERGCGRCPQLRSQREGDFSRRLFAAKVRRWRDGKLTVVSPSQWMAAAAARSPILQGRDIRVIPTGVDTRVFGTADAIQARHEFGLPIAQPLVLFGADAALRDSRKGGSSVVSVMRHLATQGVSAGLVIFGASERPAGIPDVIPVHALGSITDEARLAKLYAACDVFLAPSKQENLANTVLEAMACGTPTVAFATGGMNEAIEHGCTGLLARVGDDGDLAAAVLAVLTDGPLRRDLAEGARARALHQFDLRTQAEKYIALYREKLESAPEIDA